MKEDPGDHFSGILVLGLVLAIIAVFGSIWFGAKEEQPVRVELNPTVQSPTR